MGGSTRALCVDEGNSPKSFDLNFEAGPRRQHRTASMNWRPTPGKYASAPRRNAPKSSPPSRLNWRWKRQRRRPGKGEGQSPGSRIGRRPRAGTGGRMVYGLRDHDGKPLEPEYVRWAGASPPKATSGPIGPQTVLRPLTPWTARRRRSRSTSSSRWPHAGRHLGVGRCATEDVLRLTRPAPPHGTGEHARRRADLQCVDARQK
jgi:hypothetical protein